MLNLVQWQCSTTARCGNLVEVAVNTGAAEVCTPAQGIRGKLPAREGSLCPITDGNVLQPFGFVKVHADQTANHEDEHGRTPRRIDATCQLLKHPVALPGRGVASLVDMCSTFCMKALKRSSAVAPLPPKGMFATDSAGPCAGQRQPTFFAVATSWSRALVTLPT